MSSLILWILLRILTSIIAGIASSIRPLTSIELRIPFYPPSAPLSDWLDRAFLSPWLRWDAEWYQRIVIQGYSATDGTAQFHPLYPWLGTILTRIGFSPLFSLLVISALAGIILLYFFFKLAKLDLQSKDATFALMLFCFAPPAFILFAPYPEALFLLWVVLCIYFARLKKWWLASLMGGLATLTRQQGIILLIPVAWELWENFNRNPGSLTKYWREWFALTLIPLGYLIWLIYRAFFLFDLKIDWGSVHGFIYSFLISSSASQVVQVQQFLWPWQAIYLSFTKLISQPDLDIWVNLATSILFLVLFALSWRYMRTSYRLYAFLITWISFSYYTGPVHPYMGLARHLFLAFPIFIGLASLIRKPWLRIMILTISAIGMSSLEVLYVIKTWIA